ncbi:transmembrane protein 212 [Lepisosteus oculatus]|uniref:Transmembrane protein 212 n=1 Tax=Lepisosteus oculatus TaxID=7918 RepID=W5MKV7_LEPOC|nr:PREDICTED: transmembrane protein 212 [Lepisosteus oculatus]
MVDLYQFVGGGQLVFGILSFLSGVFAFFPVFSYKPWYVGWSIRIAAPIWTGILALISSICVLLANRKQTVRSMWETSFTFSILCTVTSPVQFAVAVAAIMIGPCCYYTFAGAVGTDYLGYAVKFPFPYTRFLNVCLDPASYEWFFLGLQIVDLLTSLGILCLSLIFVIRLTCRLSHAGHVNRSIQGW